MRNAVVAYFAASHRRLVGLSVDARADLLRGKGIFLELSGQMWW